jgi:DNA-directed RNA polymerase specialized sigma24 family protein
MEREQAMDELPETYAAALRLRGRGFDDDAIAAALSLAPEAVPPLLRVADAKLALLIGEDSDRKRLGAPE